MLIIPQNITAPQTVTLRFLSPSLGANLQTVTAASLNVLRTDGTTATWALTIVSATPSEIVCQYTFAGTELTVTGVYYLTGMLTLPGGVAQAGAIALYVTGPNRGQPRTEDSAWLVATSSVAGAVIAQAWRFVTTSLAVTPFTPWVAADSRGGALTITLWTAQDGDAVVIADPFGAAAAHNVTVAAAAGQSVPAGVGTYGASVVLASAGFSLRLRYNAATAKWLAW
jgi:hypothetical protein